MVESINLADVEYYDAQDEYDDLAAEGNGGTGPGGGGEGGGEWDDDELNFDDGPKQVQPSCLSVCLSVSFALKAIFPDQPGESEELLKSTYF